MKTFPRVIETPGWVGVEYETGEVDMVLAWGRPEAEAHAARHDAQGNERPQVCRECSETKHGACNGQALVEDGHDVVSVDCLCASGGHA